MATTYPASASTVGDLQSQLLRRCGRRSSADPLADDVLTEMDMAQRRLERDSFKPWFLLSEMRTAVTIPNEERLAVPEDFLEEVEEGSLWRYDPAAIPALSELKKTDYDLLVAQYPIPGLPLKYSLTDNYFRLRPVPDAIYQIQCQFYISHALPSTLFGGPNAWTAFAPDWLISETGRVIASTYIRDQELAAIFASEAQMARARCYKETIQRTEANYNRQMGDD